MDRESIERLRFDRRLQRRRGWLEEGQLEAHLESLPDSSGKMTTIAEAEDRAEDAPAGSSSGGLGASSHSIGGGGFASDPIGGGSYGSGGSGSGY
ncbi:MAG: hypothetical protein R3F16_00135 [Myxococcota bacterium]